MSVSIGAPPASTRTGGARSPAIAFAAKRATPRIPACRAARIVVLLRRAAVRFPNAGEYRRPRSPREWPGASADVEREDLAGAERRVGRAGQDRLAVERHAGAELVARPDRADVGRGAAQARGQEPPPRRRRLVDEHLSRRL